MKFASLTLSALVSAALAMPSIPRPVPGPPEIVGGHEVKPHFSYGFIVKIEEFNFDLCGGTLIGKKTMITAAHCTVETMLNQTRVLLHRHDTTKSTGEEDGLEYTVREAVTHPLFSDEPDYLNDISIWMLEPVDEAKFQAFDFSGTKVLLDDDNDEKKRGHEGNLMRSAGWGTTVETEVDLPIVSQKLCKSIYAEMESYNNRADIHLTQICAGYMEGGKDTCQGDSGGPLFLPATEKSLPVLVGVVSFGAGCAKENAPGVYTRISSFNEWITSTMATWEKP